MLTPIRSLFVPELTDRLIDLPDQLQDVLAALDRVIPQSGQMTFTFANTDTVTQDLVFPIPYTVGTVVDVVAIPDRRDYNVNLLSSGDHTFQGIRVSANDGQAKSLDTHVTWFAKARA